MGRNILSPVFGSWIVLVISCAGAYYYHPKLMRVVNEIANDSGNINRPNFAPLDERVGGWGRRAAQELFESLGENGRLLYRSFYSFEAGGLDVWSPLSIFSVLLCLAHQIIPYDAPFLYGLAHWAPAVAFGADMIENSVIDYLLRSFPFAAGGDSYLLESRIAALGGLATVIKLWLIFLQLFLLVTGIVVFRHRLSWRGVNAAGSGAVTSPVDAAATKRN